MNAGNNLNEQARCRGPVPPVPTSVTCDGEAPAGAGACVDGCGRGACVPGPSHSRPEDKLPRGVPVCPGIEAERGFKKMVGQADSGQLEKVVHGSASGPGSGGELPHPQGLSTRQVWAGQLSTAGARTGDGTCAHCGVPMPHGSSAQVTGKRTFSGQLGSADDALTRSLLGEVVPPFLFCLIVSGLFLGVCMYFTGTPLVEVLKVPWVFLSWFLLGLFLLAELVRLLLLLLLRVADLLEAWRERRPLRRGR